jgi:hypothetical protein
MFSATISHPCEWRDCSASPSLAVFGQTDLINLHQQTEAFLQLQQPNGPTNNSSALKVLTTIQTLISQFDLASHHQHYAPIRSDSRELNHLIGVI